MSVNYSLHRLKTALEKGSLPKGNLKLGGEIISRQDQFWLVSGALDLQLQFESSDMPKPEGRGLVWVTGELKNSVFQVKDLELLSDADPADRDHFLNPLSDQPAILKWSDFCETTRSYFKNQNMLEASTPSLVNNPGPEPTLEPFYLEGPNKFLATSPELSLKKMIAGGFGDVFEIKTCFRGNENSPIHQEEFTMLEWYRTFSDLDQIVVDFCGWIGELKAEPLGLEKMSWSQVFQDLFQFELKPTTSAEQLRSICDVPGDFSDVFNQIVVEKVDPWLNEQAGITVLYDYPPSEAALAELSEAGWARRLEIYWDGMELGNAFQELRDPGIQRQRFIEQNEKKKQLGLQELPLDEEFLKALEFGLPPCAGIAVGMDRVFLKLTGHSDLKKLRLF